MFRKRISGPRFLRVVADAPLLGQVFPDLAAVLEVLVHLAGRAVIKLQYLEAVLEERLVEAAKISQVELEPVPVVETQQEAGDITALP